VLASSSCAQRWTAIVDRIYGRVAPSVRNETVTGLVAVIRDETKRFAERARLAASRLAELEGKPRRRERPQAVPGAGKIRSPLEEKENLCLQLNKKSLNELESTNGQGNCRPLTDGFHLVYRRAEGQRKSTLSTEFQGIPITDLCRAGPG